MSDSGEFGVDEDWPDDVWGADAGDEELQEFSGWEPGRDNIRRAAAIPMRYPDVLVRTFGFAVQYLLREQQEHPAAATELGEELDDVTTLLTRVIAALHGIDPVHPQVSAEQFDNGQTWMLTQFEDPLDPAARPII